MKKVIVYASLILLILSMTGCENDDFLKGFMRRSGSERNSSSSVKSNETTSPAPVQDDSTVENIGEDQCDENMPELSFDIGSEEDIITLLCKNTWEYYGLGEGPKDASSEVSFTFNKDNTFSFTVNNNLHPVFKSMGTYTGTWKFSRENRKDYELPDIIELTIDDEFSNTPSIFSTGSNLFYFDHFGIIDGQYTMALVPTPKASTLLQTVYNDTKSVFYQNSDEAIEAYTVDKAVDSTFDASVWKVDYKDNNTTIYLANINQLFSKIEVVYPYELSSDFDPVIPLDAIDSGFNQVCVTTDTEGKIKNIDVFVPLNSTDYEYPSDNAPLIKGVGYKYYDYSINEDKYTVNAYFNKPVFYGNSDNVKWLNSQLDQLQKNYENDIKNDLMKEDPEYFESLSYGDELLYSPYSVESVYYDDNNNVSIRLMWDWYMGGVYNLGWKMINVNLNTKENLTLEEVMGRPLSEIKTMMKEQLLAEYGYSYEDKIDANDVYKFSFTEDTVFIGFDSYELDQGSSSLSIALPR